MSPNSEIRFCAFTILFRLCHSPICIFQQNACIISWNVTDVDCDPRVGMESRTKTAFMLLSVAEETSLRALSTIKGSVPQPSITDRPRILSSESRIFVEKSRNETCWLRKRSVYNVFFSVSSFAATVRTTGRLDRAKFIHSQP